MVRDKQGRKMSKSLGNSPDLLELIDRFGADAVRFGILIAAPAGNDLLFDDSSCDQGRNFNNKIWNALKLVKMWEGYSLVWDDFCSWYLEWVKPGFEQAIDAGVYSSTVGFFSELMQLLHPFMPFVTEEIYHQLAPRVEDLCVTQFTKPGTADAGVLAQGELLKTTISAIRDARVKNNIKPKDPVRLFVQGSSGNPFEVHRFDPQQTSQRRFA
jgi:valyl-tRNA synthetase